MEMGCKDETLLELSMRTKSAHQFNETLDRNQRQAGSNVEKNIRNLFTVVQFVPTRFTVCAVLGHVDIIRLL
jgi:hypothetical protein